MLAKKCKNKRQNSRKSPKYLGSIRKTSNDDAVVCTYFFMNSVYTRLSFYIIDKSKHFILS